MRVLVTNDDGVHAPGLLALAAALVADGHDVFVVAPMEDMSGSGAALGPQSSVGCDVEHLVLPTLGESVPAVAIDGPPGLCVLLSSIEAFGPRPDVVASGINPGSNTGRAVLFSGTVGAALAAARLGLRAVAVSARHRADGKVRFDTAAAYGAAAVRWLEGRSAADGGIALNVNVPDVGVEDVKGVREGRLATFGIVRTAITSQDDKRLTLVLEEPTEPPEEGTDSRLVRDGYVAVNAIGLPHAVPLEPGVLDRLEAVGTPAW